MLVPGIVGVVLDGHIDDSWDARAKQQRCDCHRSNCLHHVSTDHLFLTNSMCMCSASKDMITSKFRPAPIGARCPVPKLSITCTFLYDNDICQLHMEMVCKSTIGGTMGDSPGDESCPEQHSTVQAQMRRKAHTQRAGLPGWHKTCPGGPQAPQRRRQLGCQAATDRRNIRHRHCRSRSSHRGFIPSRTRH